MGDAHPPGPPLRHGDPFAGADVERDRAVLRLTYEAYRPMARRALERIVTELEEGGGGLRLGITHRLGVVEIGEASVAIAAHHRDPPGFVHLPLDRFDGLGEVGTAPSGHRGHDGDGT